MLLPLQVSFTSFCSGLCSIKCLISLVLNNDLEFVLGKPSLSKVNVLERDGEKCQTLVEVSFKISQFYVSSVKPESSFPYLLI